MDLVATNIYIFVVAAVLAILEIQIEGAHGWAKNLPTWRPTGTWYTKLYEKIMSGREFTGYHLTMFAFVFLIFHLPYVFGLTFTIDHWLKTLSFFLMFIVLWDFLWFVLNPHYPLSRFKAEHIWWHKKWALGAPVDYYGGIVASLLVIIPTGDFYWWIINVGFFGLLTLLLCLFTIYVLKIDKWQEK